MKKTITIILASFACLLCWRVGESCGVKRGIEQQKKHLPKQTEIQQVLVDRGYDIQVDGVIGEKTRDAWDKEYCNYMALKLDWNK